MSTNLKKIFKNSICSVQKNMVKLNILNKKIIKICYETKPSENYILTNLHINLRQLNSVLWFLFLQDFFFLQAKLLSLINKLRPFYSVYYTFNSLNTIIHYSVDIQVLSYHNILCMQTDKSGYILNSYIKKNLFYFQNVLNISILILQFA